MTTNIATTKEQSARLLQCGVSPESADMCYQFIDECFNNTDNPICSTPKEQYATVSGYGFGDHRIHITPAWSLSALLGLLPKTISDFWMTKWFVPIVDGFQIDDMENPYLLSGDFQLLHIGGGKYQVEYVWDGFIGKLPQSDNPIEACVLAVELLVANNYKLNQI